MAYYPVNGGARFKYSSLVMLLVPGTSFQLMPQQKLGEDLKKTDYLVTLGGYHAEIPIS